MKVKRFFKKVWNFIKRNVYALSVSACVLLVLTIVSVTAITLTRPTPSGEEENVPVIPSGSESVITFACPVIDPNISKSYAEDYLLEDKTTGVWQTHQGVDFKANEGAKVFAVLDGVVKSVEHSLMDGVVITIEHENNLVSVYKCMGDEALVSANDKVTKGQEIGTVSRNLTERADGPHLHFELYEGEKLIDPMPYFEDDSK